MTFAQCYAEALFFAFEHYEKFLEICTDEYWQMKAGGWKLGQQYYHGLVATNMLLASISGKPVENPNPRAGMLEEKGHDELASKEQAALFLANLRVAAKSLLSTIDDSTLLKKNEGISQKFGRDVTNAVVLELVANHLLYHLGSCDAGLRERNLPGSW